MAELKADETGNAIVPVLACVLNQLCVRNDRLPINQKLVSKFHALRPPAISIKEYLQRIAKYAACSGECFVLALVYIDRIIQSNPTFVVNSLNIHRLLITSVMLAAKFFDDQYFNNAYYAKVGGVPCNEMNSLEVEFLFMTNFTLFVTTDTYRQYYTELCNHAQNSQCGCSTQKVPTLIIPHVDFEVGASNRNNLTVPVSNSSDDPTIGEPLLPTHSQHHHHPSSSQQHHSQQQQQLHHPSQQQAAHHIAYQQQQQQQQQSSHHTSHYYPQGGNNTTPPQGIPGQGYHQSQAAQQAANSQPTAMITGSPPVGVM